MRLPPVAAIIVAALTPLLVSSVPVDDKVTKTLKNGPPGATNRCYTSIGSTSASSPVPTSWSTSYTKCTLTATSTITTTTTPVSTVTSTTTISVFSTSTIIIPAPAAFTPIQRSLPGSSYRGSGGSSPAGKREALDAAAVEDDKVKYLVATGEKKVYPQKVACTCFTHGKCSTIVSTLTTTAMASTTSLTTTTISSTTTVPTTTTVYAACASSNLADRYVSGSSTIPFNNVQGGTAGVLVASAVSAYECCVYAITSTFNAAIFVYIPGVVGATNCNIGISPDECPTNASTAVTGYGGNHLVLGNANCGQINGVVSNAQ